MKYALVIAVVLLLRLPFLNQAVQGDDVYYLAAAQHAQVDPLHPNHVGYVFLGHEVDFRGHPHPPLDAWCLAGLLALFGDIREVPFHAAYIVFSLMCALAMYSLARRLSPHPVWATLLFLATPPFVINGNSFESDIPFLAFWLTGLALFVSERFLLAAVCLGLSALGALQAILALPILAAALWFRQTGHRRSWSAWLAAGSPFVALMAWQCFEFVTSGQFPATVAAGYQKSYALQRLTLKLRNAAALSVHACFLTCPALLPPLVLTQWKRRDADTRFLLSWLGIAFLGAVAFFFSGSARYLLPMAAPLALLASRLPTRWLAPAFAAQMTLSLLLATVNYQHWGAYRDFAATLLKTSGARRLWVNSEWGLRFYLEAGGALPLHEGQYIPTGDIVVSSELGYPVPYNHGGRALVSLERREVRPTLPLRLIGLDSHSAYSTADKGFLPFGISNGPIDVVHADLLEARIPTRQYLSMGENISGDQILNGIYPPDDGKWRWMALQGVIALKPPATPEPLHVSLYIPDSSPVRQISISLDGKPLLTRAFPAPGAYVLDTPPATGSILTLTADKAYSVAGDNRQLSLILTEAGFRK